MAEIMTAKEVSKDFFKGNISYYKILEMCKRGEIPHFKVGSRVLFNIDTLNTWIAGLEGLGADREPEQQYGKLRKVK